LYITVVLTSALIVAFETVSVEGAVNIAGLDVFLVSSMPMLVGGAILVGFRPSGTVRFVRELGSGGWLYMLCLCACVALGVILWFDSVHRIGASKEAILGGGSSEVLFVVLLSAVFLGERLRRLEIFGSLLVVAGVFIVLANTDDLSLTLGFGEVEAIISSFVLGLSVVITTVLLRRHALAPLSGIEMLVSGIILLAFGSLTGQIERPDSEGFLILLGLGLFPAFGFLTYNAGLPNIGASLTSVLFALTGIMTVGVQLLVLLLFPDADMILPQSIALAVLGGLVAFTGVYLLNIDPTADALKPVPEAVPDGSGRIREVE
jgi:drug/metabolite transporter (DMT)-like permease